MELLRHNIHLTIISPGYINTKLSTNALTTDGSKHQSMLLCIMCYRVITNGMLYINYILQFLLIARTDACTHTHTSHLSWDVGLLTLAVVTVTDATTKSGATPVNVADKVLEAVVYKRREVVTCSLSTKAALWLHNLCPSILDQILKRRAEV